MNQNIAADVSERPAPMPLRPTHVEALAEMVRAARDAGEQVRVVGSNALPLAQFQRDRRPREISTLRMNKVIEHAAEDLTVTVQAGISLEALQRHLAWRNQWIPVDPPNPGRGTPGQRTIGGLIATNSLGPLRLGCGKWTTLISAMTYVDERGTIIRSASNHALAATNDPLLMAMIGACGTVGTIAEVTLRTSLHPPDERCLILFCDRAQQAERLLMQIMTTAVAPTYIQAIGGDTFSANPLELPAPPKGVVLIAGFLGSSVLCDQGVDALRAIASGSEVDSISQNAAQAGRLRLWMATEPSVEAWGEGVGFRLMVESSKACAIIETIEKVGKQSKRKVFVVSECGTAIVRGAISGWGALGLLRQVCTTLAPPSQLVITQGIVPDTRDPLCLNEATPDDPCGLFGSLPEGTNIR